VTGAQGYEQLAQSRYSGRATTQPVHCKSVMLPMYYYTSDAPIARSHLAPTALDALNE